MCQWCDRLHSQRAIFIPRALMDWPPSVRSIATIVRLGVLSHFLWTIRFGFRVTLLVILASCAARNGRALPLLQTGHLSCYEDEQWGDVDICFYMTVVSYYNPRMKY